MQVIVYCITMTHKHDSPHVWPLLLVMLLAKKLPPLVYLRPPLLYWLPHFHHRLLDMSHNMNWVQLSADLGCSVKPPHPLNQNCIMTWTSTISLQQCNFFMYTWLIWKCHPYIKTQNILKRHIRVWICYSSSSCMEIMTLGTNKMVGVYLYKSLPDWWTGCRISVDYPPRSPELTPPDFFLSKYSKDTVCGMKPATQQLWQKIEQYGTEVRAAALVAASQQVARGCQLSQEAGGDFQHIH